MKKIYHIFLLFFFIFAQLTTSAQENNCLFSHLSFKDGLSQSTVYSILKDSRGFIWFGTGEGLNRYNGYDFTVYKFKLADSTTISDSWITCIFEDSNRNLWVGTLEGGLNRFDYEKEEFASYKNSQNLFSISDNSINALCEDKNHFLWIATKNGLNKLDLNKVNITPAKNLEFTRYFKNEKNNLNSNDIISLCPTSDGELWLGTNDGGFSMIGKNASDQEYFISYQHQENQLNSPCGNQVLAIFQDRINKDILWIGNSEDFEKFNKETKEFVHYKYKPGGNKLFPGSRTISTDPKGMLWIGTLGNGLIKFDPKTEQFNNYKHSDEIYALSDNIILFTYCDSEGILWIGTDNGGVNKKINNNFVHYKNNPDDPKSLKGKSVRAILKDRTGTLWVGADQGLNQLNRNSDDFILYTYDKQNSKSISSDKINSIFEDKDGGLWIGTLDAGLNFLNRQNGEFTHYANDVNNPSSLSNNSVRSIIEDEEGYLWIGTRGGGLNKFDRKNGTFTHFKNIAKDSTSLSNDRINSLLLDKSGLLWISTSGGGLNMFDRKTGKFKSYQNNPAIPYSINDKFILSVCEDRTGGLWVGTYDGGLNYFDRKKETFEHFTEKEGLSNSVVYSILEDKQGKLWMSTNRGISRFNPVDKKFENYGIEDGLQDNEFNLGAFYKSDDGEMFFGGINGFNAFWPDRIHSYGEAPNVVLTELKIINKKVEPGSNSPFKTSIETTNQINLTYKDYIFSIEFAALSYVSPEKNRYAYKLDGFDKDWIYTDSKNRIATYTNLGGKDYTFRVKACNSDGVWNEAGTSVIILIKPPVWKTLWFRILIFVFIVTCIYAIYRWRVKILQIQKIRLEQIVKEKTSEVLCQNEELEALNEELTSTNDELYNQREELENTLNTLQEAQKQLIQSEKMASLGVLAAGVAHEINNPLNFIQGGVLGLEHYIRDNFSKNLDEIAPLLNGIQVGVSRTADIVTSLNHYSRQNDLQRIECDIHSIIDNCLVMLHSQTKNKIEIFKDYTKDTYCLICNEGKLHQAVLNILTNACHATEDTGSIKITTIVKNEIIVISIEDTGSGIQDEILSKIMDPFFTTKAPGKGTGLGLSITYNIIKEHNGTIEFQSKVGKGTKVVIELPLLI